MSRSRCLTPTLRRGGLLVALDPLLEVFGISVVFVDRLVGQLGRSFDPFVGIVDILLHAIAVGLVVLVELIDPAFRRVLARIFGRDATVRRNRGHRGGGGGSLRQRGQSGEGQRGNQGDQKQTWIHRSSLGRRERGPILSLPAAPGKPFRLANQQRRDDREA